MSGALDSVSTRRPEIKRQLTMISAYRPMLRITVTWCLVERNSENTDRAPWNSKSHNFRRHLLFFFIHPSVLLSALFENCIACKSGFIFFRVSYMFGLGENGRAESLASVSEDEADEEIWKHTIESEECEKQPH